MRPAADITFQTAAAVYGERTIGVVLTGSGRDGGVGARAIKNAGGRVLTQDQETSQCFDMPQAAIETGAVDFTLPLGHIATALQTLVTVPGAAEYFRVSANFALSHIDAFRGFSLTSTSSGSAHRTRIITSHLAKNSYESHK